MTPAVPNDGVAPSIDEFLATAELTATLDDEVRRTLAAELEPVTLRSGDVLMRHGDEGDAMYFVVHGRLGALVESEDGPRMVGRISPGGVVGELALIGSTPRLATVVALRDSELLRLSKQAFDRVTDVHPATLRALSATVVQRLAERSTVPRPASRTVAVLGAGGHPDTRAVRAFVDSLADELRRYGAVGIVDVVGTQHDLAIALHSVEDDAAFVLVAPGGGVREAAWSVRSADVVLLVATPEQSPELGPAGEALTPRGEQQLAPETHVVVLHEDRHPPQGSAGWVDAAGTDSVFHLRPGAGDVARVARFLAGRSVGVALGGGGARGFAHLGVLRALDEAGIAVDTIGGTSIGALVAGLYAMGWDADEREERALEALTRSGPLFGVTLPMLSLSSATKLEALLTSDRYFNDRQIEDLWLPYCCVSADLGTAQTVVHRRGPLALSVRASASLPGVLPPVAYEGRWLVDGGVLDNLPVVAVRERNGDGPLIAVNIRPKVELSLSPAPGSAASGWARVGRRSRDVEQRVPSLIDVLVRTNVLGSVRALQDALEERPADLLLEPPVANHRVLDFRRGPGLIRTAYEHTVAALESAPAQLWP